MPIFRARIKRQGVNPYVDVPARVSHALAHQSQAGRIAVQGRLNEIDVRGTLMPMRSGGHRLYINGGMRAAAGVQVGDTIRLELEAIVAGRLNVPSDLARALRAAIALLSLIYNSAAT
jgi:hypothetical protein